MTDQQRWDALSSTGDWVNTPHLDRIAAEGISFTNAVTCSPMCVPARLSLATGLYPHHTQVWDNSLSTLDPNLGNWMRAVREGGYRTSLFGKSHLHPHNGNVDLRKREPLMDEYGLDDVNEIGGPGASARIMTYMTERWKKLGLLDKYREDFNERNDNHDALVVRPSVLPLDEYADVYVGMQAMEYLKNYNREQPWFCWVSFGGPHSPWDTPQPYANQYNPEEMPEPAPVPESVEGRPKGVLDHRINGKKKVCTNPKIPPMLRADYAGNVTLIDDQIGKILEILEERGDMDNSWIFLYFRPWGNE